ncbi:MAG: hydrogenase expression/formation protein HypE [Calditrichaeota bacterium]|nr:hydrogenase expression/formation protein HypE [Calditrichota bacterium]
MSNYNLICPLPLDSSEIITLAHGGGGRLTRRLIEGVFLPQFANPSLQILHDGAVFKHNGGRLAFTTDSYVVQPIFFPGGDIGTLAVNGTINDLAMCGALPLYLSVGVILEEGFPVAQLQRIVASMRSATEVSGVKIIAGDTKVVNRGKEDGIYINTAGIGFIEHHLDITPASISPGDAVILSGDIGRHALAVIAMREDLDLEIPIFSDCAPLAEPILKLIAAGVEVHCLRDLTRGGLATALVELADSSRTHISFSESAVLVSEPVRGLSEMLGFDPLYLANEGRFVAFLPEKEVDKAVDILHTYSVSAGAAVIGQVSASDKGMVTMTTIIGSSRRIEMLSGEQLPRIC